MPLRLALAKLDRDVYYTKCFSAEGKIPLPTSVQWPSCLGL